MYLEDKKLYRYVSKPVPLESIPNPVHGMYAAIQMQYFSDEYSAVLPKSCIQTDIDGGNYVYIVKERDGVLGTENLVVHSTRPPKDLEKVLVIDDG